MSDTRISLVYLNGLSVGVFIATDNMNILAAAGIAWVISAIGIARTAPTRSNSQPERQP